MTLLDYVGILRRSWVALLLTSMLGGLLALGLSNLTAPVYQTQSQLFVSVQSAEEISGAYTGGLYVQQRMTSYVTLVDTPGVLDPVVDQMGLEMSSAELADSVSADNPEGSVLIDITYKGPDPKQAAAIADTTAESLAAEIIRLETTESGTKPVLAQMIRPAWEPQSPTAPRTSLNVVLGAVLGLTFGMFIAVLRATLDTSIKSTKALEEATDATLLGTVAFDPSLRRNALTTLSASAAAEAYRTIRTNLKYVDIDHPPKCVVVTSALPIEGKSTTAVNLAIALAQSGSHVLLVEADLRRPRVAEYLGVDGSVGLTDVLVGQAVLGDAIVAWHRGLLDFLPSGTHPPNPSELLGSRQLSDLLAKLENRYDVIILDAPPVLPVTDAAVLTAVADGAILVARYGKTRREHAHRAAQALTQVNGRLLGTVLNFVPATRTTSSYHYEGGYASTHNAAGNRPKSQARPEGRATTPTSGS